MKVTEKDDGSVVIETRVVGAPTEFVFREGFAGELIVTCKDGLACVARGRDKVALIETATTRY